MTSPNQSVLLRDATISDAEGIAQLHTDSWRRTYRGMMSDAFLDGGALDNRRTVWRERLTACRADHYVPRRRRRLSPDRLCVCVCW